MSATPQLRKHLFAALLAMLFALASSHAADDALAAARTEFQQAYARVAPAALTTDSISLRSYVLYPYLQAARLSQSLSTASNSTPAALDEQIALFIREHDAEPVAQDLRRNWLANLAARGKWEQFLAFHRSASDGDALRCQGFAARIELQRTEGLVAEVSQAWLTPRSLPDCERAFDWLRGLGILDDTLTEQRVRLALESGKADFARQIARPLPTARARPLLQWAALLENPTREIDALITSPSTGVEPRALLDGWMKLTRADQSAGKQRFEKLLRARKLDQSAASPLALALALPLAWDRNADALKYFARVAAADFDDSAREWQARAALWADDWQQTARSIAAMSEGNRRTARWRYWAARAAAQTGHGSNAQSLYESILTEDNYYSGMAAARLKRAVAPTLQPVPLDAVQLASMETQPPFMRARELHLCGLISQAQTEWRLGLESLQPSARPLAIHLAARWDWHDQTVSTATGEKIFNDYMLLYPRPYDSAVTAAAQLSGLAPEVIYGVIRQESLFRSDAVSSADARGLMQLLPESARRTAIQWKQPAPTAATLFDPAVNVKLGAAHLKELVDRFEGQLPLALAGYNAGPGAVQRWLPARTMDADIWIENIPYNETRTYVQRIHWHTLVFAWLRDMQPQDTQGWIQTIKPGAAAAGRAVDQAAK